LGERVAAHAVTTTATTDTVAASSTNRLFLTMASALGCTF
jgi:hypothetical protein